MLRRVMFTCLFVCWSGSLCAVGPDDILPADVQWDPKIPTPRQFLGFEIGRRHVQHHELIGYFRRLAVLSDRVAIREYARSYGGRPLVVAVVTSSENHSKLDEIQRQHVRMANPAVSAEVDIKPLPAVINMGYSVHGNEPSGGNAALLVAYYLAAATDEAHQQLLNDVVILLDPCLNPDGFERFANWANNHRGLIPNADPNHREHRETWPSGRTNYYLFDLNRDWLPVQHPESQGRVALFHSWKPNVVLDFHEMGTDATYFFQPGVPERNHPFTPPRTIELTRRFADYHAAALDKVGSLYYTEERFDDFYMGKGSTYPDLHGSIGILFEQASARGHLQDSVNGPVSFTFAIRNHFLTSLSSLRATREYRAQLLHHKRTFYQDAIALARAGDVTGYVVAAPGDAVRLHRFLEVLARHQIRAYRLQHELSINGRVFPAHMSYIIPTAQPEYRFLQSLFERRKEFRENIFYDVSTWTLPLAFDVQHDVLTTAISKSSLGPPYSIGDHPKKTFKSASDDLAYVIDWRGYYAPKVLYQLLKADVKVKVATRPFGVQGKEGHKNFGYGSLLIPLGIQPAMRERVAKILENAAADGVAVSPAATALTAHGLDFGSSRFVLVPKPKLLLLTGSGVSSNEAGEVWHLLDRRFHIPISLVDTRRLSSVDLEEYTVVVMVSGSYSSISQTAVAKLQRFVADGGTLVAVGSAIRWANDKGIGKVEFRGVEDSKLQSEKKVAPPATERRPYAEATRDAASKLVRGSILATHVDRTHPIGYGFAGVNPLPVFRNNTVFLEPSPNAYSTPIVYEQEPLLSGYVSAKNLQLLSGSASVVVHQSGRGRVVFMAENPNFRAFWYGTNRVFLNALFFGPLTRVP